jgi:hypothetical protein
VPEGCVALCQDLEVRKQVMMVYNYSIVAVYINDVYMSTDKRENPSTESASLA